MHETRELYFKKAVDALSKAMALPTVFVSWKEKRFLILVLNKS